MQQVYYCIMFCRILFCKKSVMRISLTCILLVITASDNNIDRRKNSNKRSSESMSDTVFVRKTITQASRRHQFKRKLIAWLRKLCLDCEIDESNFAKNFVSLIIKFEKEVGNFNTVTEFAQDVLR